MSQSPAPQQKAGSRASTQLGASPGGGGSQRGGAGPKGRPQSVSGGVPIGQKSGGVKTQAGSEEKQSEKGEVQALGPRTPGARGVGVQDVRWRVDVTISTSSMERVLKPAILLELTLTDGRIQTFLVPPHRLHELRYNVARVLKEIHSMQLKN